MVRGQFQRALEVPDRLHATIAPRKNLAKKGI
jgi:hypothetical protein